MTRQPLNTNAKANPHQLSLQRNALHSRELVLIPDYNLESERATHTTEHSDVAALPTDLALRIG